MITLRRSVLPVLVAVFAFVISYVILALDFRIGEYRLQSDRSTIQQEQSLSPLYRANINKGGASQANENDINNTQLFLFQIKHELHLENEPDNTLSYYNPALTNDALLILIRFWFLIKMRLSLNTVFLSTSQNKRLLIFQEILFCRMITF